MDLNFELSGNKWIAEFEANADFNLHIERQPVGDIYLYQKTAGSQYDIVKEFGYYRGGDAILDLDFVALVYPKWIKIECDSKPTTAIVTFTE